MQRFILLTLALILLLSPFAWADVRLQIPEDITVVAVNGKEVSAEQRLTLPDGHNQIALRYEGLLGDEDDTTLETSEVIVALFQSSNQDLTLEIPEIEDIKQLESFSANPRIDIVDADGRKLPIRTDILKKEGMRISRDYGQELLIFNNGDSPAALASLTLRQARQQAQAPVMPTQQQQMLNNPAPQTAPTGNVAEQMLKYWYQQADEATRQRFKEWISE